MVVVHVSLGDCARRSHSERARSVASARCHLACVVRVEAFCTVDTSTPLEVVFPPDDRRRYVAALRTADGAISVHALNRIDIAGAEAREAAAGRKADELEALFGYGS